MMLNKMLVLIKTILVYVLLLDHCHIVASDASLLSGDGIDSSDSEILQYYIIATDLEPCPELAEGTFMSQCLTLNQFASLNTSAHYDNFSKNTSITLLLQPGNHHLDFKLTVANISCFSLKASGSIVSGSNVTIECSEKFTLQNVTVSMNGIQFVGCAIDVNSSTIDVQNVIFRDTSNIVIFSAMDSSLSLQQCVFQNNIDVNLVFGVHTAVTLLETIFYSNTDRGSSSPIIYVIKSTLSIKRCIYDYNNYYFQTSNLHLGSSSNITVNDTDFDRNDVYTLFLLNGLRMNDFVIYNCTFTENRITGPLIHSSGYRVRVLYSQFKRNNGTSTGRDMMEYFNSIILIQACTFQGNEIPQRYIIYGVSSNVMLLATDFVQNKVDTVVSTVSSGVVPFLQNAIEIINCTFVQNSIQFFDVSAERMEVRVTFTHFIENDFFILDRSIATAYHGTFRTRDSVASFEHCQFIGNRGIYGAMLYILNSLTTLHNVSAVNNNAKAAGVMLFYNGNLNSNGISMLGNSAGSGVVVLASCTATFTGNTLFLNNQGSLASLVSTVTFEGDVNMSNNRLHQRRAIQIEEGGAITAFQSSFTQVSGTLRLQNNSAVYGGAMHILQSTFSLNGAGIISNNLANVSGGGIYLFQSRLDIRGVCLIRYNYAENGGGVYAMSSTLSLENDQLYNSVVSGTSLYFTSNQATESGGAFFLSTSTKIYDILIGSFHSQIYFMNNSADYGGALFIDDQTNPELCDSTLEYECFYQIYALNPGEIERVISNLQLNKLDFAQNRAKFEGDNIFGGLLDRCALNVLNPSRQYLGINYGVDYIQSVSNIDNVDSISSDPVRLCFCSTYGEPNCSIDSLTMHVIKGEPIIISVVAVDQVNHTLESDVEAFLSSNDGVLGESQKKQTVTANCSILTFNIVTLLDSEELVLNAVGPCENALASQRRVQLIFDNCTCPIGFTPAASFQRNCQCECHFNLSNFVSIENCFPSDGTFKPTVNTWISYTDTADVDDYYLLIHPQCPYDYCTREQVNVSLSQPNGSNALCNYKRTGTLCGACQPGYSLSFGSSRCMKCGEHWEGALVGLLLLQVIAGVAIVCVLLFLNMTVAMGTLNGILFYANIVYANTSIYFNNLPSPSFPSIFIAWLNLDTGFDICLFEGIDAFAKTLLQLVFPIYLIILVVAVIIISKYSQRFSNLIGKKDPIATLATLILLSYAKILSTAIIMLSITTLQYPEGTKKLWKPDATIGYLKHPKHIVLFSVAIVILLFSTTYTIILISWQLLVQFPNWKIFAWVGNQKLSAFIGTYHAPYKPQHRYWTGLLLLVRVIIYLVSALNSSGSPQMPLIAITVTVGSLLLLDTRNIYKSSTISGFEMLSLVNILALTSFTWYATDLSDKRLLNAATHTSVTVTLLMLIIVIIFHVYKYTKLKSVVKRKRLNATIKRIKTRSSRKESTVKFEVDSDTRDVNIYELVNTHDDTCSQPQRNSTPLPHACGVSRTILELPEVYTSIDCLDSTGCAS